MSLTEWNRTVRPWAWLRAHADDPGGVLDMRRGPEARLLIWRPELLEELFRNDAHHRHPGSRTLRPVLGPTALAWIDGDRWRAYRGVLGPPLHGRGLATYHDTITAAVRAAVHGLTPGTTVHLAAWTRRVTLTIASEIIMGRVDPILLDAVAAWLHRAVGSRLRSVFYRSVRGGLPMSGPALDRWLIMAARTSPAGSLAARLQAPGSPLGPIGDAELRDQVVSLLFAGHETTAAATAWTVYWLSQDSQARREVLAELDATDTDGSDAGQVPHLQALIREVLRWCPPVETAGPRMLTRDMGIDGRTLPAGTVVTPAIFLAHHRAEVFSHPFQFDPERFLTNPRPPGYVPFGGGTRRCLGEQLGCLEIRMLVTALLRHCELRCLNPAAGIPVFRGPAMAPSPALRMAVTTCRAA